MFQPWRIKLREAQEAFKRGRLEEASQLLCQGDLREFLPAKRLLAQVAGKLAERGKQRAELGETSAGWRDLEQAAMFGTLSLASFGVAAGAGVATYLLRPKDSGATGLHSVRPNVAATHSGVFASVRGAFRKRGWKDASASSVDGRHGGCSRRPDRSELHEQLRRTGQLRALFAR